MSICLYVDPVEILIKEKALNRENGFGVRGCELNLEGDSEWLISDIDVLCKVVLDQVLIFGSCVDYRVWNWKRNSLVNLLVHPCVLDVNDTVIMEPNVEADVIKSLSLVSQLESDILCL